MAIDANILLQGQVPNAVGAIQGGLLTRSAYDKAKEDRENKPLRNKLFQTQQSTADLQLDDATKQAELKSIVLGGEEVRGAFQRNGREGMIEYLTQRIDKGPTVKGGRGMQDSIELREMAFDPNTTDEQLLAELDRVRELGVKTGILQGDAMGAIDPANVREYKYYKSLDDTAQQEYVNLKREGKIVDTGGGGKAVRDASGNLTQIVAPEEATSRDAARAAQVAQGTAGGATKAGDYEQLQSLDSSLPALQEIVSNLKELGSTATYSTSGKAYDAVSRELGFKPSEGATSRAKYIATVSNEVLPLLKQTFGSAFTEKEGAALKATLGDPDLSPEEKNAQLDAFIESKTRQAESIRGKLGAPKKQGIVSQGAGQDLGDGFSVEFR